MPQAKFSLHRQSLPDALAASLRERILDGEFKEGDPLIQEAIAAEYECSRMPVREAFRQLEAAGLIELKIHKGAVVTAVPWDQIVELFDLRALLETDILRHAIPKMTDTDISASEVILDQLNAAYRQHDTGKWGTLNWEFHRSLYIAAARPQTLSLIQTINVQTDRYIRLHLVLTDAFSDAKKQHSEILRLCARKDVEEATAFLRRHILETGSSLLAAIRARSQAQAS